MLVMHGEYFARMIYISELAMRTRILSGRKCKLKIKSLSHTSSGDE